MVEKIDKPVIRWRLMGKRTALVFAVLFGFMLADGRVKYDVVWSRVLGTFLSSLFLVIFAEGIHESRERRRLARSRKEKAAGVEGLMNVEDPPKPRPHSDVLVWRDPEQLFFRYNPLYFFSAFCILSGIGLLSRHLGNLPWHKGQMLLFTVIQVYELLLLAGTAVLLRMAGLNRPAIFLCLLEVFFLFDCTFRTGPMVGLGWFAPWFTLGWVLLTVGKGAFLGRLFRLKCPPGALVVPASVLIGVAAGPYVFGMESIRKDIIQLLAVWYGAGILAYALWLTPTINNPVPPDAPDQELVQRSFRIATIIWVGIFLTHLFA